MHNPSTEELIALLHSCSKWALQGETFYAYQRVSANQESVRMLPNSALAQLHPHLPLLTRQMQKYPHEILDGKLPMSCLVLSLDQWDSPFPTLVDDSGDTHVLGELTSMSESDGVTQLKGLLVRMEYIPPSLEHPELITFVKRALGMRILFVKTEELEKSFHGWHNRVDLVEGMDLKGRARFKCLFQSTQTPAPDSLGGVTFE